MVLDGEHRGDGGTGAGFQQDDDRPTIPPVPVARQSRRAAAGTTAIRRKRVYQREPRRMTERRSLVAMMMPVMSIERGVFIPPSRLRGVEIRSGTGT